MAAKSNPRQVLTTITLLAVVISIALVLVHQTSQLVGALSEKATPAPIQAYSTSGPSLIEVEMEDVLPTFTPTPPDPSHQE